MRMLALLAGVMVLAAAAISTAYGFGQRSYPPLVASGRVVALCHLSMRGIGIPLSQRPTKRRATFGLFEFTPDFRRLRRHRNSLLRTKAPVGVTGDVPVTLTVPERARHRVALGYAGRRGRYAEIEFQPCPRKTRTVWAGGFVLRDRMPVTLLVATGDHPPRPLQLGRPRAVGH